MPQAQEKRPPTKPSVFPSRSWWGSIENAGAVDPHAARLPASCTRVANDAFLRSDPSNPIVASSIDCLVSRLARPPLHVLTRFGASVASSSPSCSAPLFTSFSSLPDNLFIATSSLRLLHPKDPWSWPPSLCPVSRSYLPSAAGFLSFSSAQPIVSGRRKLCCFLFVLFSSFLDSFFPSWPLPQSFPHFLSPYHPTITRPLPRHVRQRLLVPVPRSCIYK